MSCNGRSKSISSRERVGDAKLLGRFKPATRRELIENRLLDVKCSAEGRRDDGYRSAVSRVSRFVPPGAVPACVAGAAMPLHSQGRTIR